MSPPSWCGSDFVLTYTHVCMYRDAAGAGGACADAGGGGGRGRRVRASRRDACRCVGGVRAGVGVRVRALVAAGVLCVCSHARSLARTLARGHTHTHAGDCGGALMAARNKVSDGSAGRRGSSTAVRTYNIGGAAATFRWRLVPRYAARAGRVRWYCSGEGGSYSKPQNCSP